MTLNLSGRPLLLFFVALVTFAPTGFATSKSVLEATRAPSVFASGFTPADVACQDLIEGFDLALRNHLPLPDGNVPTRQVRELITRLHAAAHLINARGSEPLLTTEQSALVTRYLAELDRDHADELAPFANELLVIIAKLSAVLPDHPERTLPHYYAVRGLLEKVVNLKKDGAPSTHALTAHALSLLAPLRVSRLFQVSRFEDQIREAFEDLESLQREDALGDNDHLRLMISLTVFARVIPALSLYPPLEQKNRANELSKRFEVVEESIRALTTSRQIMAIHRRTLLARQLDLLAILPQLDDVPNLRGRVAALVQLLRITETRGKNPPAN